MKSTRKFLSFSLLRVFVALGAIAVAASALASGSKWWLRTVSFATLGILASAVLCLVLLRGAARAFWFGFSFFGWGYLSIVFVQNPIIEFDDELLLTSLVLAQVVELLDWTGRRPSLFSYESGQFQWALLLACAGGLVGRYCYSIRGRIS